MQAAVGLYTGQDRIAVGLYTAFGPYTGQDRIAVGSFTGQD